MGKSQETGLLDSETKRMNNLKYHYVFFYFPWTNKYLDLD